MVFDNQLEIQRIEKSEELRKLGINPYPHFLKKDMNIKEFRDKFEYIKELDEKRVNDEVIISERKNYARKKCARNQSYKRKYLLR